MCSHKKVIMRLRFPDPSPSPLYEFYDLSFCRLSAKATPCMSTFDLKHVLVPEFNRPARSIQASEWCDSVVLPFWTPLTHADMNHWKMADVTPARCLKKPICMP